MVKRKISIPAASNKKSPRTAKQQAVFAEASDPLVLLESIDLDNSDLDELGKVVRDANQACKDALLTALNAAIIVGKALQTAKDKYFYDRSVGGFRGWIEEQGVSSSAAYRYLELAKYSGIVSQAGTLSEAHSLIAQYKLEQNPKETNLTPEFQKLRTTLKLQPNRYQKLEAIANQRGIEYSDLISEVLNSWLSRQKIDQIIDVESSDS